MVDRRTLGQAALALAGAYGAMVALTAGMQRKLIYPAPQPPRSPEPRFGEVIETTTPDGQKVFTLWSPSSPPGGVVTLFFHGNGEQLADVGLLGERLRRQGVSVLAVEYPGYGLAASQSPSEAGLFAAGEAAVALLRTRLAVPVERTVITGHSLGTGVATEMARRGHGVRLALVSPFTSMGAMAQRLAPFLPGERLIVDRYDSLARAPSIAMPTLLLHGDLDELIPVTMSRELVARFPHATLDEIAGAHHNDMFAPPHGGRVLQRLVTFLRDG